MKKVYMLEVSQPIGTFYIGKMSAADIISISKVNRRKDESGHQRQLKESRAKEIATYCNDPDATFPTPIILSVSRDDFGEIVSDNPNFVCFTYDTTKQFAELLDGQHRIAGISRTYKHDFELPVIVMFDLREAQKAYVFSMINGNQVKVDRSLIYDLFALSESRSPYKTCHQIARAMNSEITSPFFRRLKMLEQKTTKTETISQNTFVTQLSALISKKPQEDEIHIKRGRKLKDDDHLVFRKYFINGQDEVILRILNNYFGAVAFVFEKEWDDPAQYILTKTIGFTALMKALEKLIPLGEARGDLSKTYFVDIFHEVYDYLEENKLQLTSSFYSSSAQDANRLAKIITDIAFH